jgi:hypothetical protein
MATDDLFPTFVSTGKEAGETGEQFSQLFGFGIPPAEVKGVTEPAKLPRDIGINLQLKTLGREIGEAEEEEDIVNPLGALRKSIRRAGGLNYANEDIFRLSSNYPLSDIQAISAPTDPRKITGPRGAATGLEPQDLESLLPEELWEEPTDMDKAIEAAGGAPIDEKTFDWLEEGYDWASGKLRKAEGYFQPASRATTAPLGVPYVGLPPSAGGWTGTGYGSFAPGAGAVGAQVAGQAAGAWSVGAQGYGATIGAGASTASWATRAAPYMKYAGHAFSLYGAKKAWDSGDKAGAFLHTASLIFPPLKWAAFAYDVFKMFGRGGGAAKPPMGAVEYRVYDTGTGKNVMPWDADWNTAEDHKIRADASWGYNGWDHQKWRSASQKNVDYMYAFAEEFDLDVNEEVFIRAAMGEGVPKYKPSGDRQVSWLERVDSVGNGAPNANGWLQAVFEYESPAGERIIDGNIYKGVRIDPNTGMPVKVGYKSQDKFEKAVGDFNKRFWG